MRDGAFEGFGGEGMSVCVGGSGRVGEGARLTLGVS
jgi:hypothetical protein